MWRSLPHAHATTHVKVSGRKVQRVSGLGWILEQHRAVTGEVEDDNRAAGAPERDIVGLQPPGRVTHVPVLVKRKPAIFWIVLNQLLREQRPWLWGPECCYERGRATPHSAQRLAFRQQSDVRLRAPTPAPPQSAVTTSQH